MAENIQESSEQIKPSGFMSKQSSTEYMNAAGAIDTNAKQSRPYSAQRSRSETTEERDQRLKMFRDKQNDERQRKLEELKAQALAAQRFREMKEEERRRRIEELRVRDSDRRQQVGERKRLIYEAERDRRESILKKNMEREARYEMKKRNERSSLAFAFGSSTPRMLEPADTGGSFWGHRRATSTHNITFAAPPLTRRSSERELEGSKKRATSAGGLDRGQADDMRMSTSMYEVFHWGELPSPDSSGPVVRSSCNSQTNNNKSDGSALTIPTSRSVSSHLGNGEALAAGCVSGHVGRRRTDLMPTIPNRDSSSTPVRKQPFTKSPGRTYSLSRLDQLAKPRKRPGPPIHIVDLPAVVEHRLHHNHNQNQHSHHHLKPLSSPSNIKSMSRSMGHLAVAGASRLSVASNVSAVPLQQHPPQRPLRKSDSRSMHQLSVTAPLPPPRATRATLLRKKAIESPPEGPSRPDSSLSHQSTSSVSSTVNIRSRPVATPRKPRPASIAVTGVTHDSNKNTLTTLTDVKKADLTKPPLPRTRKTSVGKVAPERTYKLSKTSPKATPKVTPLQSPCTDAPSCSVAVTAPPPAAVTETQEPALTSAPVQSVSVVETNDVEIIEKKTNGKTIEVVEEMKAEPEPELNITSESSVPIIVEFTPTPHAAPVVVAQERDQSVTGKETTNTNDNTTAAPQELQQQQQQQQAQSQQNLLDSVLESADMTASMIAKVRITTEEEAKAALAEKRRRAREEAERQAEMERQRIEAEALAEQERQRQEEEQARLLAEQQRRAEEERLAVAIKEAQKREEEEKLKREEELRQKLEKEEQERKAREESEKQRIEMQERLKQEEKEREARRKRVEAIMLRTRAKGSPGNNQPKDENEKSSNDDSKNNQVNNKPTIEEYEKEVSEKEAALFNGSFKNQSSVISKENGENGEPQHSNGHRNGVDMSEDFSKVNKSLIEHNVTNTLLDLGEIDPFKNANTSLDIPADKITNEDNVNSNNPTESHSTTDFLL